MPIPMFSTTIVSSSTFTHQQLFEYSQSNMAARDEGISTNPEQVAVWIESIGVCSHLAMAMDGMYSSIAGPASAASTVKDKEEDS